MKKTLIIICLYVGIFLVFVLTLGFSGEESLSTGSQNVEYTGEFTTELPIFKEIKGKGNVTDEVAQLAVGVGVKYRLLPSVVLGQWAYESMWGRSFSAKNDNNYFFIT